MSGALDGSGDDLGSGQAARPRHPAGEISAARFHDAVAALYQGCQVGAGGGVLPHVDVHGGGGGALASGWAGGRTSCHMLPSMAGARSTGPVTARYRVVRKSSARPWASLAIRSAVA